MIADALGRRVAAGARPSRIVSLVPSETESVVAIAGIERLAGRTRYCEEPRGRIEAVPSVGGTKDVDVEAVLRLEPDLVLANREENTQRDVERLIEAGLNVHVSFPCSVEEALAYLRALGELLHERLQIPALEASELEPSRRAFVPIWREPWMTLDARTYGSDVLRWAGADNVFGDRTRRYPLAADLDHARAVDPGARDTRYPRVGWAEIEARAPDLVLLPDEPYAFSDAEAEELGRALPRSRVRKVSGKDLFWYGVRTAEAVSRLATLLRTV